MANVPESGEKNWDFVRLGVVTGELEWGRWVFVFVANAHWFDLPSTSKC